MKDRTAWLAVYAADVYDSHGDTLAEYPLSSLSEALDDIRALLAGVDDGALGSECAYWENEVGDICLDVIFMDHTSMCVPQRKTIKHWFTKEFHRIQLINTMREEIGA